MATKKKQKDNTTLRRKIELRRLALDLLTHPGKYSAPAESAFALLDTPAPEEPTITPVVMETHGGYGRIYLDCYAGIEDGVVFETDEKKVLMLAEQRPTWAVYQADCEHAIKGGAGAHLEVNLLDVDPYGDPWLVIDAFFRSERPRPERMVVVVNDGLRQKLRMKNGWDTHSLLGMVDRHGNDALYDDYLDICRDLIGEKAALANYSLDSFTGYHCGSAKQMTHYLALLTL
jgi:hypothetical protein